MGKLNKRLDKVAKAVVAQRPHWQIPIIDCQVDAAGQISEADESKIESIREEAIQAGWRPIHGPYVMVVHIPFEVQNET